MADQHEFAGTVVAVLDREPEIKNAVDGLRAGGFNYEVLVGEEGKEHLDPSEAEGPVAMIKRLVTALGDENQVMDRLFQELDEGKTVVSVVIDEDDSSEAISILQDHGGEYLWKFGNWTFTRIGDDG